MLFRIFLAVFGGVAVIGVALFTGFTIGEIKKKSGEAMGFVLMTVFFLQYGITCAILLFQ